MEISVSLLETGEVGPSPNTRRLETFALLIIIYNFGDITFVINGIQINGAMKLRHLFAANIKSNCPCSDCSGFNWLHSFTYIPAGRKRKLLWLVKSYPLWSIGLILYFFFVNQKGKLLD
jgi:hypothetical protein